METIAEFLSVLKHYIIEILPFLALGFFLSGLVHEFVPPQLVDKHLGGKGIRPIFYATLAGTILPICCLGSLPIAISLRQKGARLGPVLAFLVATPATSLTAILVCLRLLGIKFSVFIFFAVILLGVIMGLVGNLIKVAPKKVADTALDPVCGMKVDRKKGQQSRYKDKTYYFCSSHCQKVFQEEAEEYTGKPARRFGERVKSLLRFAFVDMIKEIGPELVLGLLLAALVASLTPVKFLIKTYLAGGFGYLFSLFFGLVMYICSTASVPMVHSFISAGMSSGAGMVMLLVGPITSWGTILVIRKEFGLKILSVHLAVICFLAVISGYIFSLL